MEIRDNKVSMVKGVAITLMVLAHSIPFSFSYKVINMFHMPIFFFFSGFCFKEKYLADFKTFAKKRIKGLYVPYVMYSLFFLALHNIFFHINIYNGIYGWNGQVSQLYTAKDFFFHGIHIIARMYDHEQLLGGYWFLHTLLWASFIAFFVIKRFNQNYIIPILALLFCSFFSSYFNKHIPIIAIGTKEFIATIIFYVGYLIHQKKTFDKIGFSLIPIAAIFITFGVTFWQMEFLGIHYTKILPWLVSAILGVMGCFKLCLFIVNFKLLSKILTYIGNNTLPILTWHFICFKITSFIIILLNGLPIERLAEFPVILEYKYIYWYGYLISGIGFPLLINLLFTKLKYFFHYKFQDKRS